MRLLTTQLILLKYLSHSITIISNIQLHVFGIALLCTIYVI